MAQSCGGLGQTPNSAFPVCGTFAFTQTVVPECAGKTLPTPCGNTAVYTDKNPYWYKFTCYTTGSFSFQITPKNLGDDYDWQLFDITGHNPSDIYSDGTLIISANWSGSPGVTGTSATAKNTFECASNPTQGVSTFSKPPNIIAGHEYLLLISHYDDGTQSGYDLSFPTGQQPGAGTSSIVDPLIPAIKSVYGICDGSEIVVVINKKVKCSSLAADGTDFSVSGPVAISVVSAVANNCSNSFDMDTVRLKLSRIMSPGSYTVTAKAGSDGNSLIDNCNNSMPGQQGKLNFIPAVPTPMDSITPVTCIKDTLQLVFSKPMKCSSIATDGSDFSITGPVRVTVKSAKGICSNGVSTYINIVLTAPIRVNGTFTITLRNGSDGNTLIDECSEITPAGSTLSFTTKNITTADFQATVAGGCKYDTLLLTHNGYGGTTQWNWMIDSVPYSTVQNPVLISRAFGTYRASLAVANGFCADTASKLFTLPDLTVKAGFISADTLCPTDALVFTDNSSSNVTSWLWKFGNGNTSTLQNPPGQSYPLTGRPTQYTTSLTASNSKCSDIAYKIITTLASCYIAVPSAFTPNGDGINDYLYPLNAFKADDLVFRVFNRYGQVVFESKDYSKKWDGRFKGLPQPSGTYVWTFSYTLKGTGEKVNLSGTVVLIR
ncbi:MAG: gliding motility-associated C-terminal domain-containing protein [Chitinophagaceae bacterium]|nr:gliding motility-associated C-terminal domain-containing protein [Chitinophagaceae bacterium]